MVEPRAVSTCSACGSELSGELATGGLCPGCLIDLALDLRQPSSKDEPSEEGETLVYEAGTLAEGQVLGNRYRIQALLGRGGMGEVWRAVDLKLRVEVALKSLRKVLLSDERALETLRQEVRMAREVVSPNVCRVFDLEEVEGHELVSMEYIDGVTLLDILRARAPLPLAEAREIASQFLAGLEAIHTAGLAHRDVKPENLMMTRSGRVVLMDFGIAKGLAERATGTVSGTPAYMAPEQGRGVAPDARVDVFSAGIVLAEMTVPEGLATFEARQAVWHRVHRDPPELPDSPWAAVLGRAVARQPEQRYASAAALARALEEVTLRVERAEDVTPYPGLASFSTDDAEYFFGRELEVEEMWKKLERPHLLGLIGPSGAGKSSFLRAGLLAVMPTGWRGVVATPGSQPFANLAAALVPQISGDTEALQRLVRSGEEESLLEAVRAWRDQHDEVLIVLDQFEELFTQNPTDVQKRFSELMATLAVDGEAHVVLAMRDDFLFHCSSQPALSPMFSELTPLRPPTGTALRRSLVQPALKCGYRFEDDALVDEMVAEVSAERGALPMLAFAAAKLWEHRDGDQGLLTREAYEHIGGVSGALAQHAEKTLETIGRDQVPIVREIFRNLVTSQGTRAARTREELLSVFGGTDDETLVHSPEARSSVPAARAGVRARPGPSEAQRKAEDILDALIDARLLTSYELPATGDEAAPEQRIEIIHESLLSNWPRLVRWQTQDADGAQLRDQLRQAARMWEERGHPEDLLWTGTSFEEFQLWRERYAGGLSAAEETFALAMTSKAQRRRQRRRMAVAVVLALAIAVATVTGGLWRQAAKERDRAEANQLLALGRLELQESPTGALAYAIASLERGDDPVTRLFALEVLWREPIARILGLGPEGNRPGTGSWSPSFSRDGKWLVAMSADGRGASGAHFKLWSSTGGEPLRIDAEQGLEEVTVVEFGPAADLVVTRGYPSHKVQIWSLPEGRLVRTLPTEGPVDFRLAGDPGRIFTFNQRGSRIRLESWPPGDGDARLYGEFEDRDLGAYSKWAMPWPVEIAPDTTRFAYVPLLEPTSREVYSLPTEGVARASPRRVTRYPEGISGIAFLSGGPLLTTDRRGTLRMHELDGESEPAQRSLHAWPGGYAVVDLDPTGSRLANATPGGLTPLWDLEGPPDAGPTVLHGRSYAQNLGFHPQGEWLARGGAIWPIARPLPRDLHGHELWVSDVAFLPDGMSLASTSEDGTLRLWPLSPTEGAASRVLFETGELWLNWVAAGPEGKNLLTGRSDGEVWLVAIDGAAPRSLGSLDTKTVAGALTSTTAAACRGSEIRVWNLATGEERTLQASKGERRAYCELTFRRDGRLISAGGDERIRIWNLEDGTHETMSGGRWMLTRNQTGDEPTMLDLETVSGAHLAGLERWQCAALDPTGKIVVTMPEADNWLQVGPPTVEEPHLLIGTPGFGCPTVSPDGRWIASPYENSLIRLWPMPDLTRPPLHTLPHDELLAKLRTITNLRVVRDPESASSWGWALDPFPGWEEVPTW